MGTFIKQNDLDLFSSSELAILVTDCFDDDIREYLKLAEYKSESNDCDDKMTFIYQYLRSYFYDNENKDLIYDIFLNVYARLKNINIDDKEKRSFISRNELELKFKRQSSFKFDIVTSFLYDVDFIKLENSCLIPLFEGQELSREQIVEIAERFFEKSTFVVVFDSEKYLKK